jgi:hypothetical protein
VNDSDVGVVDLFILAGGVVVGMRERVRDQQRGLHAVVVNVLM